MATFRDEKEQEWSILIDAPKIMRVREECDPKFLLNDTQQDSTYERLESDPVLLCRVIYVLCEKQRLERNVSEEDFYLQIVGNAIDSATVALLKAITSFSPRRTRELLEATAGVRGRIQQRGMESILKRISDPELEATILENLDQQIDAAVAKLLSTPQSSATSEPAPSESSQTGELSAS